MEVSGLQRLAIEVFKTLKSLKPGFMHTYFKKGSHSVRRKKDLVVNRAKATTFGEKSLTTLAPGDVSDTARKMKFSIKDFFSKCDQIRSFLRIWLHLLNFYLTFT